MTERVANRRTTPRETPGKDQVATEEQEDQGTNPFGKAEPRERSVGTPIGGVSSANPMGDQEGSGQVLHLDLRGPMAGGWYTYVFSD